MTSADRKLRKLQNLGVAGAIAAVLVAVLLTLPALAGAATITVTTLEDPTGSTGTCTLRDAITAANTKTATNNCVAGDGTDTIQFGVTGTITLSSELPAIANTSPNSLTIDGSGQAITLDGANTYQIFNVNSGATLNLQFLTLADGSVTAVANDTGQGGAIFNSGMLTIANSTFSNDQATGGISTAGFGGAGEGGAIFDQ